MVIKKTVVRKDGKPIEPEPMDPPMWSKPWFVNYVYDWYTDKDYQFRINGINKTTVKAAVDYLDAFVEIETCYDTHDREITRDIILYWLGHPLEKLEYNHLLKPALKKSMEGTWKCL